MLHANARRVGQHDVDALLGTQARVDEELRERARALGDLGVGPRAIAEPERDLVALALAHAIEQEVVGEVEVVGEPDVGHLRHPRST